MAKVALSWPFDGLSGQFGNAVYVQRSKELINGQTIRNTETYVRAMPIRTLPVPITTLNIAKAFKIMTLEFATLKADATALATWDAQALAISESQDRFLSTYQLFMSFFLTSYTSYMTVWTEPSSLGAGTSLSWTDRFSRLWA